MKYNLFSKYLQKWHQTAESRRMPWVGEKDPYKIWLSEVILQQTRVAQGLIYYEKFLTAFPTVFDLARAPEKKVFKLWEGLGYYSRCRNLIATAKNIVQDRNGCFPNTYSGLLQLKGIGSYTAAAIASFAYNQPYAVVDGNVFRVLSRVFGIETPIDTAEGKKQFFQLAQALLDKKNPATFNQAIMDLGATTCKPLAPICNQCPFKMHCKAYADHSITALPIKQKKIKLVHRYFYFFVIEKRKKIAVRERTGNDIWKNLFEFPCLEALTPDAEKSMIELALQKGWLPQPHRIHTVSKPFVQKLSHQVVQGVFIKCKVSGRVASLKNCDWLAKESFSEISFPKLIHQYLKENDIFSA